MISLNHQTPLFIVNNHIPVKAAADASGYNLQYLRRLLRTGKLTGLKIGQVWLIDLRSLETYLVMVSHSKDNRFGSKK
jgi:hypothetical protein